MKNLLFIHAHDVGRAIATYGVSVSTPHLVRLASEGVLMEDVHSAAPTCSPSRAAMWIGRTAHENGMLGLVHRGFDLQDRSRHLMSWLGENGFHTVLAGLQHEYDPDSGPPIYQEVLELEPRPLETRDFHAAERAAGFLESSPDGPWALSVGFFYPHRRFLPAVQEDLEKVRVPEPLPDVPEVREDFACYAATVQEMDRCVGRVMEGLARSGQERDTLVVFTTDHGIAFPDMKCSLTAHGTGVSLILRQPGRLPSGEVRSALVSHLDLSPTLCGLLGVNAQEGHGVSFAALLKGEDGPGREDVFAEVNFHASAEPARCVRTAEFSLIRRFTTEMRRPWANTDNGPSKNYWRTTGEFETLEPVALFDLKTDPLERKNVADLPEYKEIREEMEARLWHWMETTDDPLLKGPLQVPQGAKINPGDCVSPNNHEFLPAGSGPVD